MDEENCFHGIELDEVCEICLAEMEKQSVNRCRSWEGTCEQEAA